MSAQGNLHPMTGAAWLFWTTPAGQPGTLRFDLVKSISPEFTSTVTKHPVEKGADVTDHVHQELDRVSLSVYVTNTPIIRKEQAGGRKDAELRAVPLDVPSYTPPLAPTPGALFGAAKRAVIGLFGTQPEYVATVLAFDQEFNAPAETETALRALKETVQLVTVTTEDADYENLVLTSVSKTVGAEEGDGAAFELVFEQIRIVSTKIVDAPKPLEKRGAPPVKAAAQKPSTTVSVDKSKTYKARELVRQARAVAKTAGVPLPGGE